TEEEEAAFIKRLDAITAPLAKFGVHVSGTEVKVDAFPTPVKGKIDTMGYGEGSLVDLVELAGKVKSVVGELKSITWKKQNAQYKAMSKEEKRVATHAYDALVDVTDTAAVRMGKVMKLAKTTASAIKHLYKA